MIFEEYNSCWPVESDKELIEAIYQIKDNKKYQPYNYKNTKLMLKELIYCENNKSDILSNYVNEIIINRNLNR